MNNAITLAVVTLTMSTATAGPGWAESDPFLPDPARQGITHAESAHAVRLTVDFARLVELGRPAGTVILGNTAIATANLSDDRTLILTGRMAGSTNLIVLDAEGEEIANLVLEVVAGGAHLVTVHQGMQRQTYSCARGCDPVLSVGDDAEAFSTTAGQISTRQGFADSGAVGQ
ncbi:pilus assembly protein N-terminal domain-containing protein [Chelativorans salis]|uniref:Pilus assembly protein N-terminal domain-containing protein n=1 Tax=Chelativorans salis TaxID=2978478 RepID=A0ABT2LIG2_9HYPH|nr:pilus assembly protein N-terminal domain-containing protein [Chelativorans sp. EGI FJ00035]MCT7374360.1 pilus assembly protein N-terminal domain-containing protein [Chelativorans sp. EGI FJ00035]